MSGRKLKDYYLLIRDWKINEWKQKVYCVDKYVIYIGAYTNISEAYKSLEEDLAPNEYVYSKQKIINSHPPEKRKIIAKILDNAKKDKGKKKEIKVEGGKK